MRARAPQWHTPADVRIENRDVAISDKVRRCTDQRDELIHDAPDFRYFDGGRFAHRDADDFDRTSLNRRPTRSPACVPALPVATMT